jgi:hypothetical protein
MYGDMMDYEDEEMVTTTCSKCCRETEALASDLYPLCKRCMKPIIDENKRLHNELCKSHNEILSLKNRVSELESDRN